MTPGLKRCRVCRLSKPPEAFHLRHTYGTTRKTICIECGRAEARARTARRQSVSP